MEKKFLVFYYDEDTRPEDLQRIAGALENRFANEQILFIPKVWDFDYSSKAELIEILEDMIEYVKESDKYEE